MILTCTNKAYHKAQSLVLPFVGEIKLDDKGQFDCPDDKVDDVIKSSSVPFVSIGGSKKTIITPKVEKEKKPSKAQIAKAVQETQETVVNKDELIEAITEASIDELKQLVELVPGASKDVVPMEQEQLRAFLLTKLEQVTIQ